MAVEMKRGCGYRKIGGTYLEGDPGPGYECGRLPLPIKPCPLCDQRPAFTRSLQRIAPANLLHVGKECDAPQDHCAGCPLNLAVAQETAGLRVPWPLPRWFEVGKTWVFLAHEHAMAEACEACGGQGRPVVAQDAGALALQVTQCETCRGTGSVPAPGVFHVFRPSRVVRIVPDTMPEEEREALRRQGLTLVVVPADDPDHQPGSRRLKGDD